MRFPYRGAGAVIICNGMVLLGRREKRPFKGTWCIPGGGAEKGETALQTAIRETMEETGIVLDKPSFETSWTKKAPFFSWTSYCFELKKMPETKPVEFSELRWVPVSDISSLKGRFRPFLGQELAFFRNLQAQCCQR